MISFHVKLIGYNDNVNKDETVSALIFQACNIHIMKVSQAKNDYHFFDEFSDIHTLKATTKLNLLKSSLLLGLSVC